MIFGFFSRWKKAGKASGVTGGAGKLCAFDKDGNVISSGIDPDDISHEPLYIHYISLQTDEDTAGAPTAIVTFSLITRSQDTLHTWAKLRDAVPQQPQLCAGSFYYSAATVRFDANVIYRNGSGSTATLRVETNLKTGQTMPPYFDFDGTNTYSPTDTVKEI